MNGTELQQELREYNSMNYDMFADSSGLRRLIEETVRGELAVLEQRLSSRLSSMERVAEGRPVLELFQSMIPLLNQSMLESMRAGMQLSVEAMRVGVALREDASVGNTAGVAAVQSLGERPATGQAVAESERTTVSTGAGFVAPWLAGGQVLLLVSPLEGFAEVQQLLGDLRDVEGVYEVKPRRFSEGRLYLTLSTELPDAQAIADVLSTHLSSYRLTFRSVQSDLIELLVNPPAISEGERIA